MRMFLHHFLSKEFQDTSITTRNQCMYRISLYSFAKVYFHIFTDVRYLHIFSPELYFFIIIFAHLFQESKSPRRPPGLAASLCGARHGCAPSPRGPVVKQIRYSYLSFSRLSETNASFVLVSWRFFILYQRNHETKNC